MSGPFREMFVEVAEALLEAAVIERQQRMAPPILPTHPRRISMVDRLNIPEVKQCLSPVLGWVTYEARRNVSDDSIEMVATLPCGHRTGRRLADWALAVWAANAGTAAAMDNMLAQLNRQEGVRHCYCVPRST